MVIAACRRCGWRVGNSNTPVGATVGATATNVHWYCRQAEQGRAVTEFYAEPTIISVTEHGYAGGYAGGY